MALKKLPLIIDDPLDAPVIPTQPAEWWDTRGLRHPLTDAAFVTAFCDYVFETSDDRDLTKVRNRTHRFIRNFMHPRLETELTKYREMYP